MLDEFRSTLITWDKATSRIYSPVTANASDENGRKLVVQIVNSGQVEDLTGATLHLYWETRDKAHDGLDVFKTVDLKKGEFELSYTTGMLSNQGVLNANLVLIDTVGRVVSERFKITVTEGIDDDAIQSENSFSSLTQALIDVSNLEQNYAPRLNDLTTQLQHKAEKTVADNLQGQLNALVLGAVGDGNNAEVIQARVDSEGNAYQTIKRRNDNVENILKTGKSEVFTGWRLGFINTANQTLENAKVITSVNFIDVAEQDVEISISNGFSYTVHYLTSTGELRLGSAWYTDSRIFTKGYANKIKVSILSPSTATVDDSLNIKIVKKIYPTTVELQAKIDIVSAEKDTFLDDLYKYIFKNVICIGDSLTRGYYTNTYPNGDAYYPTYPQFLQKITGWVATNAGRSGATAKEWYDERINLFTYSDKDIAVIYLGTNYGLEDTVDTDLSNATNAGSYCRIIERLLSDNQKMKIFLCTVSNVTSDADGSKTTLTNNTIRKIANKYSNCYTIELKDNLCYDFSEPVAHPHNDVIHFGSIGYNLLAHVIAKSISDIVVGNLTDFEVILDEIH